MTEVKYFSSSVAPEWYQTAKEFLETTGIFDIVDITDASYPLDCKIGGVSVFRLSRGNSSMYHYDTSGNAVFTVTGYDSYAYPCYLAHTDRAVYLSGNNGSSLREWIFSKDESGKPWWLFWYSQQPTNKSNQPRTAYFDRSEAFTFPFLSETNNDFSQTVQVMTAGVDGYVPTDVLQFLRRQINVPAINGGNIPYLSRVQIGDKQFLTSGEFLIPCDE